MNSRLLAGRTWTGIALALVLALGIPATGAAQSTQSTDVVIDHDFTDIGIDPCTGEAAEFVGHERLVMHDSVDSAGGQHQMQVSLDATGTGTGLSGAQYAFSEYLEQNVQIPGPPDTTTTDFHFYLKAIRQGELFLLGIPVVDDFVLHTILHVTFNAAGVPTATVAKGDPLGTCR
jgi:hypothetical protein